MAHNKSVVLEQHLREKHNTLQVNSLPILQSRVYIYICAIYRLVMYHWLRLDTLAPKTEEHEFKLTPTCTWWYVKTSINMRQYIKAYVIHKSLSINIL